MFQTLTTSGQYRQSTALLTSICGDSEDRQVLSAATDLFVDLSTQLVDGFGSYAGLYLVTDSLYCGGEVRDRTTEFSSASSSHGASTSNKTSTDAAEQMETEDGARGTGNKLGDEEKGTLTLCEELGETKYKKPTAEDESKRVPDLCKDLVETKYKKPAGGGEAGKPEEDRSATGEDGAVNITGSGEATGGEEDRAGDEGEAAGTEDIQREPEVIMLRLRRPRLRRALSYTAR